MKNKNTVTNRENIETLDRIYSVRITESQYRKLNKNPVMKEHIAKFIRTSLDSLSE